MSFEKYKNLIDNSIQKYVSQTKSPLFNPVDYILSIGGKRIRSVLTLMSYHLFKSDFEKATDTALALEFFHNFSLIHDDIMDKADKRRGMDTVHKVWNEDIGILSGDAMLIESYHFFKDLEPIVFKDVVQDFSKMATKVCEGQYWDMVFEFQTEVSEKEYLQMIENKTAVLIATSLKLGAMLAGTSEQNQKKCFDFGIDMGIAFQIQDDLLDAFGEEKVGKRIGGDIVENKKTFLWVKAQELGSEEQKNKLDELFNNKKIDDELKISEVKSIFKNLDLETISEKAVNEYTEKGLLYLNNLDGQINTEAKNCILNLSETLLSRKF